MDVTSFSEAGGHEYNEDAFIVRDHPSVAGVVLCFVADGQGGQPGGGPAAELACRTAAEAALRLPPDRLTDPLAWTGLIRVADEAVRADAAAGYTTLVGLCATDGGQIVGASCGDSAALVVNRFGAEELTRVQRKNPPVGSGSALPVTFAVRYGEDRRLLVMTDGVWKYVGWERLIAAAKRERRAGLIAELQKAARLPGSGRFQDDFTVVLLEGTPGLSG